VYDVVEVKAKPPAPTRKKKGGKIKSQSARPSAATGPTGGAGPKSDGPMDVWLKTLSKKSSASSQRATAKRSLGATPQPQITHYYDAGSSPSPPSLPPPSRSGYSGGRTDVRTSAYAPPIRPRTSETTRRRSHEHMSTSGRSEKHSTVQSLDPAPYAASRNRPISPHDASPAAPPPKRPRESAVAHHINELNAKRAAKSIASSHSQIGRSTTVPRSLDQFAYDPRAQPEDLHESPPRPQHPPRRFSEDRGTAPADSYPTRGPYHTHVEQQRGTARGWVDDTDAEPDMEAMVHTVRPTHGHGHIRYDAAHHTTAIPERDECDSPYYSTKLPTRGHSRPESDYPGSYIADDRRGHYQRSPSHMPATSRSIRGTAFGGPAEFDHQTGSHRDRREPTEAWAGHSYSGQSNGWASGGWNHGSNDDDGRERRVDGGRTGGRPWTSGYDDLFGD
jgi:hypothetical protein